MRDVKDMSTSVKPYWKQIENLRQHFFIIYVNSHKNLTDEDIENLDTEHWLKETYDAENWGAKRNGHDLSVDVKYLTVQQIEQRCSLLTTNKMWICQYPACYEKTPYAIRGPSQAWFEPLCSKHIEEYRAALKQQSFL
jgi:hypothetical protein